MLSTLSRKLAFAFVTLLSSVTLYAAELNFDAVDMPSAQKAMREHGKPLVLYVSTTTCGFCRRLDRDVMATVLSSEQYQQDITVQKLYWDSAVPVAWVNATLTPDQLATNYRIIATPTLLFLNADGEEIAERIEGYRDADFYWFYFDQRINEARAVLAGASS